VALLDCALLWIWSSYSSGLFFFVSSFASCICLSNNIPPLPSPSYRHDLSSPGFPIRPPFVSTTRLASSSSAFFLLSASSVLGLFFFFF
jgi:hypothetical protein